MVHITSFSPDLFPLCHSTPGDSHSLQELLEVTCPLSQGLLAAYSPTACPGHCLPGQTRWGGVLPSDLAFTGTYTGCLAHAGHHPVLVQLCLSRKNQK